MLNFKKIFSVFLILSFGISAAFAGTLSKNPKVSPYVKVLIDRLEQKNLTAVDAEALGLEKTAAGLKISLILTKKTHASLRSEIQALGGDVGTESDRFMTVYIPENALEQVVRMPGITYVSHFLPAHPTLDVSVPVIQADRVHNGESPLPRAFKGKNVIVGIVDSGIDWSHGDFKNSDGTTRILYIWDQTTSGKQPAYFNYGTEWNSSEINSGSCTEVDGPANIGHGTHVTGIAAGNGLAIGKYAGVAPEANIIVVKTDFNFNHIIDAVEYVFRHAGALGEPAVVNLSLATQQGPHDGTTSPEQLLAGKVGKGKIVVVAASNEGGVNVHTQLSLSNEEQATGFAAYSNTNSKVDVDIWYSGGNLDVALAGLDTNLNLLTSSAWVSPGNRLAGQAFSVNGKTYGIYTIDATETNNPFNGLHHVVIEINNNSGAYDFTSDALTWVMKVRGTGNLHAWVYGGNGAFDSFSGSLAGLNFVGGNSQYSIGMPATSSSLITVGSFVTKTQWKNKDGQVYQLSHSNGIGHISGFSSIGPTRDGRIKPDIAAPGEVIASAMSADAGIPAKYPSRVLPGEKHFILQGTSMASPHVAGVAALMLEKDSGLTPELVKQYLTQTALSDSFTGSVPNNHWGYGKVNAFQAMSRLVTSVSEEKSAPVAESFRLFESYPNPLNLMSGVSRQARIRYRLPSAEEVHFKIVNLLGQVVKDVSIRQTAGTHQFYWNGRNREGSLLPSGIYFYEIKAGRFHRAKKMVLVR